MAPSQEGVFFVFVSLRKSYDMQINVPDNPNPTPSYLREETFANPLNLDARNSNAFYCLITGNTTVNLINTRVGATYFIQLVMDDTGGHTVTLGAAFRGAPSTTSSISTTAGAVNYISVIRGKGGYLTYNVTNITVETTTTTTS